MLGENLLDGRSPGPFCPSPRLENRELVLSRKMEYGPPSGLMAALSPAAPLFPLCFYSQPLRSLPKSLGSGIYAHYSGAKSKPQSPVM